MNDVMLLKLVANLIKTDKPTVEQVQCARTIIQNLIEAKSSKPSATLESELDDEAEQARRELM